MRTTLTLEDRLFRDLKNLAHETNAPLKEVVDKVMREGLRQVRGVKRRTRPYRTKTFRLGQPVGVNLDKALALVATSEDHEMTRKLMLRK